MARLLLALVVCLLGLIHGSDVSSSAEEGHRRLEIWDLQLGAPVDQLPNEFIDYACGTAGGPPSRPLDGWRDFHRCRPEPSGFHEVYFRYDDELEYWARANNLLSQMERYSGTKSYGFSIVASVLFYADGTVGGIRIVSDPRDEARDEAYLLRNFLTARLGRDGWACEDLPPAEGETSVEGLPPSSLRDLSRKLTFVPAGHRFHGWQKPRVPSRVTYFYLDPNGPTVDPELHFGETEFKPKLFFFDRAIWETAMKLKSQIEGEGINSLQYADALGVTLLHELMRLNNGSAAPEPATRGGLAGWQQKRVTDYIEDNLAEEIPLATLAGLATLSPYHFARAFKHSFATPPHRYHTGRRIERAKVLLSDPDLSVTAIAAQIGFREGSSLTAAFRKLTGKTPSEYRRSLL